MKTRTFFLTMVMIIFSLNMHSQELILNATQSQINWTGKAAFSSYSLTGTLKASEGQLNVENNTIKSLNVVINMKSLDHDNKDLKSHLRNEDFFEVNTYKIATFELTEPAKIVNGKATITGNMTIKNMVKKETVNITISNKTISFNHSMDRTLYGVQFNSPSIFKKMKENAIADKFRLKGTLIFE